MKHTNVRYLVPGTLEAGIIDPEQIGWRADLDLAVPGTWYCMMLYDIT